MFFTYIILSKDSSAMKYEKYENCREQCNNLPGDEKQKLTK